MDTPDELLRTIMDGLATATFEGIPADSFWDFAANVCNKKELSNFTKIVLWNWLLKNPNFELWKLDLSIDSSAKKNKKKNSKDPMEGYTLVEENFPHVNMFFDKEDAKKYKVKVTPDYQSLYLTGLLSKDNILGKFPYDLLRVIAKYKSSGITSTDLIKESGQDNRSLTVRLATLEDNNLIKKTPVIVDGAHQNHLTHFRFLDSSNMDDSNDSSDQQENNIYFDRYLTMTMIIDFLKKEELKARILPDLFEEIKQSIPALRLRWYNSVVNFLVKHGFVEFVKIEHQSSKTSFPAVRLIKDLMPHDSYNDLLDKLRETKLDDNIEQEFDDSTEAETCDDIPQSKVNRFFPFINQMYKMIDENPGIISATIESELIGNFHNKIVYNNLEYISTLQENPETPYLVVGKINYSGKSKFYRYKSQKYINLKNNVQIENEPIQNIIPPATTTIFEESVLYGSNSPKDRKLRFISLEMKDNENKYYIVPKNYPNELGRLLALKHGSRAVCNGIYKSSDGLIEVDTKNKTVVKNKENYKSMVLALKETALKFNQTDYGIKQKDEIIVCKPVKEIENLDYGPEFRRQKLLQFIDKDKCVAPARNTCRKLSYVMKLDYMIDTRTLKKDGEVLESKNLIKVEKHPITKKMFFSSIKNPPSSEDIERIMKETEGVYPKDIRRNYTDKIEVAELNKKFDGKLKWKSGQMNKKVNNVVRALNNRSSQRIKKYKFVNNTEPFDSDEEMSDDTENSENQKRLRKKKRRGQEIDINDDDNFENKEGNGEFVETLLESKKPKRISRTKTRAARVAKTFKKIRAYIRISSEHILTLIKAIIITQSFSQNGNADWEKISNVFDDVYTIGILKRQWPRSRKLLGQHNLLQAKKNWENVLMDAISNREVTVEDLNELNIHKFLDLWKGSDADIFINKNEYQISAKYEENFESFEFVPSKEDKGFELFKDPVSMVLKQQAWASANFMYPVVNSEYKQLMAQCDNPTPLQIAKSKLKALFTTQAKNFDSVKVRKLFENTPKELYEEALTELENKKAIAFLGEDSKIKFTLTDRLMLLLDCKMDEEFVSSSKRIFEIFNDLNNSSSGLVLSNRCPSGSYATIFSLFAELNITITRVDQKVSNLDTYYTKAQDRSRLESDFIISHIDHSKLVKPINVPKPIDSPCSLLWIDLNGNFNEKLFLKCVYVIVWSVVFNIGIDIKVLCYRMEPLLEPFEVKRIVDWLVERGNITMNENKGYWPTSCWYDL